MRSNVKLFLLVLILYLATFNETNDVLNNFELLSRGVDFIEGNFYFSLGNYVLYTGLVVVFLSLLSRKVLGIYYRRAYLVTRCSERKFKFIVLKEILMTTLYILAIKQVVYLGFFLYARSVNRFYYFDMVSTLLTLGLYGVVFALLKERGVQEKYILFGGIVLHLISQLLDRYYVVDEFFSVLIIAPQNWETNYVYILLFKLLLLVALVVIFFLSKNLDRMLGDKEL